MIEVVYSIHHKRPFLTRRICGFEEIGFNSGRVVTNV